MLKDNLFKFGKLFEFLKVLMINNQIETNICEMHLFNLIIKLRSLQYFESVSEYV